MKKKFLIHSYFSVLINPERYIVTLGTASSLTLGSGGRWGEGFGVRRRPYNCPPITKM